MITLLAPFQVSAKILFCLYFFLGGAGYQRWQIRQPAPQSQLRKLRQRAPARCKGPPDHLLTARYACFVLVMQKM